MGLPNAGRGVRPMRKLKRLVEDWVPQAGIQALIELITHAVQPNKGRRITSRPAFSHIFSVSFAPTGQSHVSTPFGMLSQPLHNTDNVRGVRRGSMVLDDEE